MFFPPKLETIIKLTCFGYWTLAFGLNLAGAAQDGQYQQRMAAMEQARNRGYSSETNQRMSSPAGSTSVATRPVGTSSAREGMPNRGASSAGSHRSSSQTYTAAAGSPSAGSANYRTAQLYEHSVIDGGSPVIHSDQHYHDHSYYVEEGSGYAECGESCGYFNFCGDRGGCPDDLCWLSTVGQILYRGDYFVGAQGFQTPMFAAPGTANASGLIDDSNFGFYGGFNLGLPLCRLTCGLFSGQFGIRSVQTNFGGAPFTPESRDQLFMTAGFFRRVDYGFQGGVVADIMWENWFTNSNVVQVRGELSYLWAGGTSFGFRYHGNISDDVTSGSLGGAPVAAIRTFSEDSYRFFLRHEVMSGGFGDLFVGWTDSEQTIFGFAFDVPLTHTIAAQTGVTYYLDDTSVPTGSNVLGGYVNEAWNVYAGFSWRPAGRSWYRGYDRPLFDVADNGSMLIRRQ